MPLTDLLIKSAKPTGKVYRIHDTGGLYLEISLKGSKLWRLKYRIDRKEKRLALGAYPSVGLKEARAKRDDARKLLAEHVDPGQHKQGAKIARLERAANNFESVAREWFERVMSTKAKSHRDKVIARLENDIFPWLGKRAIAEISAPELLACLRRIEERGTVDTAHRALQNCGQVFRYAVQTGRTERNPAADLRGALPPAKPGHFAAIVDPKHVGPLLRAMDSVKATFVVKCALRLIPFLFCRPIELRTMRWADVNLDVSEWNYVPAKIDLAESAPRVPHLVPLAAQAVAVLRELYPLTGRWEYVFPGARDKKKPMSDGAVNNALRNAGYSTREEHTGHGFRAMARTILHEGLGYAPEVIEHQLAHRVPDSLGTAYNRTKFLVERRKMMQQWADYLDHLRETVEEAASVDATAA